MPKRRSRSALLGALLAFAAIFGLAALSGWHNAIVHNDDPIHLIAMEHDRGSSTDSNTEGSTHCLAHATCQWVALAEPFMMPVPALAIDRAWSLRATVLRSGVDPSALLRPPRG